MRSPRSLLPWAQGALIASLLWGCGAAPTPPSIAPISVQGSTPSQKSNETREGEQACLEETRQFYKRAWRSIDDYLDEIKPLLSYLSALDTDQVGQRLHRAHYLAEFQEQVLQRFRLMERVTERCEAARPGLLRYRGELILKLSELM